MRGCRGRSEIWRRLKPGGWASVFVWLVSVWYGLAERAIYKLRSLTLGLLLEPPPTANNNHLATHDLKIAHRVCSAQTDVELPIAIQPSASPATMEVDASRIPGSSVLSSYPPPQSFDSYTLSSRGWTFPSNDQHSPYMPSSQSNLSAARDYRYNPGQEFFTHPPPPPMPIHNQSQSHISHSSPHSHSLPPPSQSYHVPPESWSAPEPDQHQQHHSHAPPGPSNMLAPPRSSSNSRRSPSTEAQRAPNAALLYAQSQALPSSSSLSLLSSQRGVGAYSGTVTRLPPILQVEKQQVTTSATQAASASRRRNEANFICPVPGCGSTFTRRFNLRGNSLHSSPVNPRARRTTLLTYTHLLAFIRSSSLTYRRASLCLRMAGVWQGICPTARLQVSATRNPNPTHFLTFVHRLVL